MKAPLLLLLAGDDRATTPDENDRFDRELTEAKLPHKKVVYEGAPHSFFDRSFEQYQQASEDAWRQMLSFIKDRADMQECADGLCNFALEAGSRDNISCIMIEVVETG